MSLHNASGSPHRLPPGMIDVRTSATPNAPWFCAAGTFAGKHLVAELGEEQGAVMGRKYSVESAPTDGETRNKKDGRPINPHPIVRVRIFTCGPSGEGRAEVDPSVIEASGIMMLCNVTLYPYNLEYDEGHAMAQQSVPMMPSPILSGRFSDKLATENTYPPEGMARLPQRELGEEHAVYRHLTHGARDVQHVIVPELHAAGRKAIYFVFKDLMIAEIGHFVLKYKLMLLDPVFLMNGIKPPLLATCWGRIFAIYPSKKAPNLKRSTPLEWHLHRNGGHISHPRNVSPESRGTVRNATQQRSRGTAVGRGRTGHPAHAAAAPPSSLQSMSAHRAQDEAMSDEEDEDDDMTGAGAYQDFLRSTSSAGSSSTSTATARPSAPTALYSTQHHSLPSFAAAVPHSPIGSTSGRSAASLPPSSPGSQSTSDHSAAGSPHLPPAAWGSPPAPFSLATASAANSPSAGAGAAASGPGQTLRRARYDPTRDRWV